MMPAAGAPSTRAPRDQRRIAATARRSSRQVSLAESAVLPALPAQSASRLRPPCILVSRDADSYHAPPVPIAAPSRPVVRPCARLLPPAAAGVAAARRKRGDDVWPLRRRGVDFGWVVALQRAPADPRTVERAWRAGEPVFAPGMLGDGPVRHAAAIAQSLRMFDRLRRGGDFLRELERRLADDAQLRYAGSTVDHSDPREIERVFVDAHEGTRKVAEHLWAKLAWIADDGTDRSLRIRFSSGHEQLEDWLQQTAATARWVDEFAARAFPECAAVAGCAPLLATLRTLIARPFRLSERIVYNNAPGGGAVFHHDAEPGQLGVAYNQLEGRTAWLTLAKRRLARLLVRCGAARHERAAMARLDRDGDEALWRLLNRDIAFCQQLSAHGALYVLVAGDSILLPSHGIDDVAWHSVFALGERPSLAHSYGIFPDV